MAESSAENAEAAQLSSLVGRGGWGVGGVCEVPWTQRDMKGFLQAQKRKETKITMAPSVRIVGRVPHTEMGQQKDQLLVNFQKELDTLGRRAAS